MINDKAYWEERFSTGDWQKCNGEKQSEFFAKMLVNALPKWLRKEMQCNDYTVIDYGCAEGAGTAYIARHFPRCSFTGVDFAVSAVENAQKNHPVCNYRVGNIMNGIEQSDIVITSNTLEHFKNPIELLNKLVTCAVHHAIILLPFEDDLGIEEHLAVFDAQSLSIPIEGYDLSFFKFIDCRLEKATMWEGKQILLVYTKQTNYKGPRFNMAQIYNETIREYLEGRYEATVHLRAAEAKVKELAQRQKESNELLVAQKEEFECKKQQVNEEKVILEREKQQVNEEKVILEREKQQVNEEKVILEREKQQVNEEKVILEREKQQVNEEKVILEREKQQVGEEKKVIVREIRVMKATTDEIAYWLQVAGRSEPMRAAHFFIQLKHALFGTKEERKECWRWLRGDRSFIPKFSYIRQIAECNAQMNARFYTLMDERVTSPEKEASDGLNGYEYKYLRWQKKRNKHFNVNFTQFQVLQIDKLVSIILPVYNGEDMVGEAIESILAQTYKNFELIVIDDGSHDRTPKIVDYYAREDKRIRVIHQKNSKLPRALNNGFAMARGEFLTWTSCDNNMHPDCVEKLVGYMEKHPDVAMCYANIRVIDGKGKPITTNTWYSRGESTGNVYLPDATLRLNTYAENTVAAAFMYRRAVPMLVGGYDPALYTVEDYDYWMRINDFFGLRHVDFEDIIYDYRFHSKSLTSKAKELHINEIREKLMLMEDFRQDWLIRPMCWLLEENTPQDWTAAVHAAGHIHMTHNAARQLSWPCMGSGVVQLTFARDEEVMPNNAVTADAIRVLVRMGNFARPLDTQRFDMLVQICDSKADIPRGWFRTQDVKGAFDIIQIYCKAKWFFELIKDQRTQKKYAKKATIVLCTYKRVDAAKQALKAMLGQQMNPNEYEILIVNNNPSDKQMREFSQKVQYTKGKPNLRYIDCPYAGLSMARNFSIYDAQGGLLLYIDDDGIMRPDCLKRIVSIFETNEKVGIAGGQILLKDPKRFDEVVLPGYEGLWSQRTFSENKPFIIEDEWNYPYGCNYAVRTSVAKELGGFRISYGRVGKDFAGGEEVVLSHLAKQAGYQICVDPQAIVIHDVDPSRYTLEHVRQTMRAARLTNRLIKMDLYKPFDLGMQEEYMLLSAAQERMKVLDKEQVPLDDLRRIYCKYDIDATLEAIRAGNDDIAVMQNYDKRDLMLGHVLY